MSNNHLSEHQVSGYLDRELTRAGMKEVERHLGMCSECRAEVSETRRLLASAPGRTEGEQRVVGERRHRRWGAASMLAAAGLATVIMLRPAPGTDEQRPGRGAQVTGVMQTIATYAPPESARIGRNQVVFSWAAQDAESYRVSLAAEDGALLWSAVRTDTMAAPPASLELQAGRRYFWYVDAIAAGVVARTGVRSFTLVP